MKHHVPRMSLGSQGWEGPTPPGCTEGKQAHQVSLLQFPMCFLHWDSRVLGKRLKFTDTDYLA